MACQFVMPKQVFMGDGALEMSRAALQNLGKKALIVTDQVMVQLGNVKRLTDLLDEVNVSYALYQDINGEPTDRMIEGGLSVYREEACDCLIAVGGGSPIDSMKAIGAVAGCGGKISDYMGKEIKGAVPPMAAVPTTAGTGSEATQFTIITDTEKDIKMLLKGGVLMPDMAIVDPVFTMTAPPKITAATGLDALTHAIEAYTSRRAGSLSDLYALSAVKRIFENLPVCYHDGTNRKAREEMSLAAFEAGVAFNNSSVTVVHGMSRPIGALFHVAHGISNAMLLKACLSYVMDGAYGRFAELGRVCGAAGSGDSDQAAAEKFLARTVALCRELEIPTLSGYGIDQTEFYRLMDKMADDALASGSPANTRKVLGKDDILKIYSNLWEENA
ncbi:iron-containing alcohol dehydrogenase [Clostridium sp. MCC353]|uniref:iron-containing alcohol dehydrogenase n=1 Tax=Clostridium sp. MCC353 TaxID=2592646 RepID=UPI001C021759|nr:iron-containing alcohol dehydrogenase [Clostridium sp. MCC353]MBT9775838.1 iron-containing alcohol dehydrogenase [Clostridium sp. MCC353]